MRLEHSGLNRLRSFGIKDYQIGIAANGYGSFAREKTEEFGGMGGGYFDKLAQRKAIAADSFGVQYREHRLQIGHARPEIGDIVSRV